MTALELADAHPDFRALCEAWKESHEVPLPLADLLREFGLDAQADAVVWAAAVSGRKDYVQANKYNRKSYGGLYPYQTTERDDGTWQWAPFWAWSDFEDSRAALPTRVLKRIPRTGSGAGYYGDFDFARAVAHMLDAHAPQEDPCPPSASTGTATAGCTPPAAAGG